MTTDTKNALQELVAIQDLGQITPGLVQRLQSAARELLGTETPSKTTSVPIKTGTQD